MIARNLDEFYDLYGLTVSSAIPLPARPAMRLREPDLWIREGDPRTVTTGSATGGDRDAVVLD